MFKNIFIFAALVLVTMFSITGCNESDCPLGSANELKFRFLSISDSTTMTIDTVTVTALGTDSVLVNKEINASYITLPLNSTQNETTYTFHFTVLVEKPSDKPFVDDESVEHPAGTPVTVAERHQDNVTVRYTSEKKFTSMDCGLVYSYVLTDGEYTKNFIKAMAVTNFEIKESNEDNIFVFF